MTLAIKTDINIYDWFEFSLHLKAIKNVKSMIPRYLSTSTKFKCHSTGKQCKPRCTPFEEKGKSYLYKSKYKHLKIE